MNESTGSLKSGSDVSSHRPKCLIACSGSVATLKVPELVAELSQEYEVMIICTANSYFFLEKAEFYNAAAWQRFEFAGGLGLVLRDSDEWQMWSTIGNWYVL
jgi:hypothetical protein